tara:strand:+ start:389 stop:655 length:267 start_codon:yes stop_codon:yes gene_type:complete
MKRRIWMVIAVAAGLLQFMLLFGGVAYYRNLFAPFENEWIETLLLLFAFFSLLYPAYVYLGMKEEFGRLKEIERQHNRSQNQSELDNA